jgi:hypothetical protein
MGQASSPPAQTKATAWWKYSFTKVLLAVGPQHFFLAHLAVRAVHLLAGEELVQVDDAALQAIRAIILENPRSPRDEEVLQCELIQLIDAEFGQDARRRVRAATVLRPEAQHLPPPRIGKKSSHLLGGWQALHHAPEPGRHHRCERNGR